MRRIESKIVVIYLLLITYLVFGKIIFINSLIKYQNVIDPLVWLGLFFVTYFLTKDEKGRYKNKNDKFKTILIIVLSYLMLYFASGLVLGYVRSPYSHSMQGILNNIWQFITVIIFEEYIRAILVGYTRNRKWLCSIIVIIFSMYNINFYNIGINFISFEEAFKYISSEIFPVIIENCIFTYLVIVAGVGASLTYRIPILIAKIVLPIFPDFNWFFKAVSESIVPVVVYITVSRSEKQEERRKRSKKRIDIVFTLLVVILLFFVTGVFKYRPISIISNSMVPVIRRGDIVIIERYEEDYEIQVGEVIEYRLDHSMIVHRVIEKKLINGVIKYRTKGDANNSADVELVDENQIEGIAKFKIAYIGYPAIMFHDIFAPKANVGVETPD